MTMKKRRRRIKLGVSASADVEYHEAVCDDCSRRVEIPAGKEHPKPAAALKAMRWRSLEIDGERRHRCDECEAKAAPAAGSFAPAPSYWPGQDFSGEIRIDCRTPGG